MLCICLYYKFSHVYNTWFETWHAWICICARLDGVVPQWIFQFHVVFSFVHRRFHPSASSFAPVRSKPRSASLTLEVCAACLCTAVIYSLFGRVRLGVLSYIAGVEEVNQGGAAASAKFVDFKLSERGEFVDIPPRYPMYREPSWKLLVMQLAAGAGNPGQTDSSHIELISRALSKRVLSWSWWRDYHHVFQFNGRT